MSAQRSHDEAVELVANIISQYGGMRFDGFWSRLDEMDDEGKAHAIAQAEAVIYALK